jgi:hypothetical protein
MKETRIKSFTDFHLVIRSFLYNRLILFRGQNDINWPLIPKMGREEYKGLDKEQFFGSFRRRAIEFLNVEPINDWDWYAVAQHHSLPTPLLDWSYNPLVAAYFAVFPVEDKDCAVYAYHDSGLIDTSKITPDQFKGVGRLVPRGIVRRIVHQSGNFTYHNPVTLALEDALKPKDILCKIVIDKSYRREFAFELDKYGFNRMTLFPDLDGLAQYMAWTGKKETRRFWSEFGKGASPSIFS